jgi:hypothetical protein
VPRVMRRPAVRAAMTIRTIAPMNAANAIHR